MDTTRELTEELEQLNNVVLDDTTARFKSNDWAKLIKEWSIDIGGLGGIGSWTALLISRLNPKEMFLFDPDDVELVNLAGQLYKKQQDGVSKVNSLRSLINDHSNYFKIDSYRRRFHNHYLFNDKCILIGGFDNMSARQEMFNIFMQNEEYKCLIDGRLNTEEFQIFCIDKNDTKAIEEYKTKWLFDQTEGESILCSNKQTSFTAAMIGSFITNLVVSFIVNYDDPIIPRDLPFLTTYNAFKIKLEKWH